MLKVKRLREEAILPTKANELDLGYDLYASRAVDLMPNAVTVVHTDISVEFPFGTGGIIKDRSSIATKKGLFTVAGVIDGGYTGEIGVALFNNNSHIVEIGRGDKIAQLILVQNLFHDIEEVQETSSADGRGERGYGSSGARADSI